MKIHDHSLYVADRRAQTWTFSISVRLKNGHTFSTFLDARKEKIDRCFRTGSVVSWACASAAGLVAKDLECAHLEGFVHNSTPIGLESLKDLFPENQKMNSGEIIHAAFDEVHPGRKDYMNHPSIKKFLQETSLDPLASGKRERVDYCGSSACEWEIGNTKTWFGCGAMRCSDPEQVEEIFRSGDVAHRQLNTLGLASVISFSCASAAPFEPESAASNTMAVEVLVHSSKMIRHGTLEAWLDPFLNPRIVKFVWKPVRTGKGNSYMHDPTVQKFLDETMLDTAATAALAGKRQRVDLASPSSITLKKAYAEQPVQQQLTQLSIPANTFV